MSIWRRLFGHPESTTAPKQEGSVPIDVDSLLSDIVAHVELIIGDESQSERLATLLSLGPSVIPNIDAAIERIIATQGGNSTNQYQNGGKLCEVIGNLGTEAAFSSLSHFANLTSNIWEYRYIREGAERGLTLLTQTPETPTAAAKEEIPSPIGNTQLTSTQPQSPPSALVEVPPGATMEQAREIMGEKNFFGSNEWERFFGGEFQLGDVPEIPWSEEDLRHTGISQPSFLFLGMENLEGMSLETPELAPGGTGFEQILSWYQDQVQASTGGTYQNRWYQMPIGVVQGLWNLDYAEQAHRLPAGYEVPTATERLTANILFHLLNDDYLDDYIHDARTRTQTDGALYILIRIETEGGGEPLLITREASGAAVRNFGIAASRKIAK
jgi:hypothetical protein